MKWIEALKIWNAEHNPGKWCVARKGSAEYDQVKAIMDGRKAAPKTAKEAVDESDALLKEIDGFLAAEKKSSSSVPKAPSRDHAAEAGEIHKIASEHAERYAKTESKKALVKAFLRRVIEYNREVKEYEAAKAKEKPARSKAPLKARKEAPKEESGRTSEQQKLHLSNMINVTEETLMSVEAKLRSPITTPGQRTSLTKKADMMKKTIQSLKAKLRKL